MSDETRALNALLGRLNEAESRIYALEVVRDAQAREIATLKVLVQKQSRVIGEAIGTMHGSGSTVKD
jgi:hypothetical protein